MRRRNLSAKERDTFTDAAQFGADSDEIRISNNELDSIDNLFALSEDRSSEPKKRKSKKKRSISHYVTIGLSKKEYKRLQKMAQQSEVTISEYILGVLEEDGSLG